MRIWWMVIFSILYFYNLIHLHLPLPLSPHCYALFLSCFLLYYFLWSSFVISFPRGIGVFNYFLSPLERQISRGDVFRDILKLAFNNKSGNILETILSKTQMALLDTWRSTASRSLDNH